MDAVPRQFQMPGIPRLGFEANSLHDSFLWALLQTAVSSEFNWSSHPRGTDPKTMQLLRTSVLSFNLKIGMQVLEQAVAAPVWFAEETELASFLSLARASFSSKVQWYCLTLLACSFLIAKINSTTKCRLWIEENCWLPEIEMAPARQDQFQQAFSKVEL